MPAGGAMREQTMDEILASIHRMITDGDGAADTAPAAGGQTGSAAGPETSEGWMAEQVAAEIGRSVREAVGAGRPPAAEPLERRIGRRFADGLAAGSGDVTLIDVPKQHLETDMSEVQRAAVPPARTELPRPAAASPGGARASGEDRLLSDEADGVVGGAFDTLSRTIFSQNPRTLEDVVRDLLRPMLRSWLDQNLPRIVERMVKQEIERVSRGER